MDTPVQSFPQSRAMRRCVSRPDILPIATEGPIQLGMVAEVMSSGQRRNRCASTTLFDTGTTLSLNDWWKNTIDLVKVAALALRTQRTQSLVKWYCLPSNHD